jgi:hypothetical protein
MMKFSKALFCVVGALLSCCAPKTPDVFKGPADTWEARARQLPLSERYHVFRYGITKMEPPVILDDPMADGGKVAADLIMYQNDVHPDDFVLVASVHVYDRMKSRKIWSICASKQYIHAKYQARLIKNKSLRDRYVSYLHQVCPS